VFSLLPVATPFLYTSTIFDEVPSVDNPNPISSHDTGNAIPGSFIIPFPNEKSKTPSTRSVLCSP